MQYFWTCIRHMTPCTGADVWISWRGTVWYLSPAASFVHTGTDYGWWIARGILQGSIVRFLGGDPGEPLPPPFSMRWWTQWCINGYHWRQEAREVRTGEEGRCYTAPHFYIWKRAWLHQRN